MSRAMLCDQCDAVLPLNARGEHEGGEDAAWIVVHIATLKLDVCSRSCAHELLDRADIVAAHDSYLEVIAGITRDISDDGEVTP